MHQELGNVNKINPNMYKNSTSPIKLSTLSTQISKRYRSHKNYSSIEECPLSSTNLGIISETDHKHNQCICELCSCGNHTCPAKLKDPYPISMFDSQYKKEYRETNNHKSSPIKSDKKLYKHDAVTYETSNDSDFKPTCKRPPTVNPKQRPSPCPQSSLLNQTSYSSTFLN